MENKEIGQPCLARINAAISTEGTVCVRYIANHTGHQPGLKDCTMAPSVKEDVMRKLLSGIPRQRVLAGGSKLHC